MVKYEVCYDSNKKVVSTDNDATWSTHIFDFEDLWNDEVIALCHDINDDNLNSLGYCESEEEVIKAFLKLTVEDDGTENSILDIEYAGPGIYVLSAFFVLGEAYISPAKITFIRELESMNDEHREYFREIKESD